MKDLNINIEEIKVLQHFGYTTKYTKVENIKHKRKKINEYNYNTKKMKLIYYKNNYTNDSNFNVVFIYQAENKKYIIRIFTSMGETFELGTKELVLVYVNNNTLF